MPSTPLRTSDPAPVAEPADIETDGRRLRAQNNRARIVQAFLALVAEGSISPTAVDVAQRADVGLRSVFRHFTEMEALYRDMAAYSHRLAEGLLAANTEEDTAKAVEQSVATRARIYEQLMPFELALQAHEHESATLRLHRETFTELQRRALLQVLPKRAALKDKPLVEALHMALSFRTWQGLRRDQGLNRAIATRVVTLTCNALLATAWE